MMVVSLALLRSEFISLTTYAPTYLCISAADERMSRHVNKTIPTSATVKRNLVFVTTFHIARDGGSRALADFHVMPPLGISMLGKGAAVPHRETTSRRKE
jgi:hypothetical protein